MDFKNSPNEKGYFGDYGGSFIPETLSFATDELNELYKNIKHDQEFWADFYSKLKNYVGRPTPIYLADRLSAVYKKNGVGANIYLKREDLNHTGAHKVNNALGQALLAKKLGKTRIIAETGAGQHGVATATVCAKLGLKCVVYMGAKDIARQAPNVTRMKILGAEVVSVQSGTKTLKDALNEALRDWVTNVENTFYIIGTVAGPAPYPEMVRDFQKIIGEEAKQQFLELNKKLPDALVACIGGGSNAIGLFYDFLNEDIKIYGVEAGGLGVATGKHAAPLCAGTPGVLHGNKTYIMQDKNGQILDTHSVSAGLDYPGVGPEHSWLKDMGRVDYVSIDDKEALASFYKLTSLEGIIPALESSHAIAYAIKLAQQATDNMDILVCLSGRGDKDMETIMAIKN